MLVPHSLGYSLIKGIQPWRLNGLILCHVECSYAVLGLKHIFGLYKWWKKSPHLHLPIPNGADDCQSCMKLRYPNFKSNLRFTHIYLYRIILFFPLNHYAILFNVMNNTKHGMHGFLWTCKAIPKLLMPCFVNIYRNKINNYIICLIF